MAHYVFNIAMGDRSAADARLRAGRWEIGEDEPHRDAITAGDLVLIHVAGADGGFIGRAEVRAVAGGSPASVQLGDAERWDRAVPMETVVAGVDPTESNPLVQRNLQAGFATRVVRITDGEYAAAVDACRDYQAR